jgi:hypothetical protein
LVETGTGNPALDVDVLEISRPRGLGDIANLGLTLPEAKQLLARVQRAVVAAQAQDHSRVRPDCSSCGGGCHIKDWRAHQVATLFGTVAVRLPRFRCAGCGYGENGISWPSHCRSTPELDQLRAHLSALMPYRVAAGVIVHLLPVEAGKSHETLRAHTLELGGQLRDAAAVKPTAAASGITITLDATFIRSCHDGERHLEVRIGNVETADGRRQVFGAVAKTDTDIAALIWRSLETIGRSAVTALTTFTDGGPGLQSILTEVVSQPHRLPTGSTSPCGSSMRNRQRADCRSTSRGGLKLERRSSRSSSAYTGGSGTARRRTPGSRSSGSARSCMSSRASAVIARQA